MEINKSMGVLQDELVATQMHLTQLQREVEELSKLVLEQWKVINKQGNSLVQLADKLQALEENASGAIPVTVPPHW